MASGCGTPGCPHRSLSRVETEGLRPSPTRGIKGGRMRPPPRPLPSLEPEGHRLARSVSAAPRKGAAPRGHPKSRESVTNYACRSSLPVTAPHSGNVALSAEDSRGSSGATLLRSPQGEPLPRSLSTERAASTHGVRGPSTSPTGRHTPCRSRDRRRVERAGVEPHPAPHGRGDGCGPPPVGPTAGR